MASTDFGSLLHEVRGIVRSNGTRDEKLGAITQLLAEKVDHYDWVGFYLAEPETKTLVLGPYTGDATEHTRIRYGEGICGQAAHSLETFVVQDVSKESNYLSCSPIVKSEIVVPIMSQVGNSGSDNEGRRFHRRTGH